MSGQEAIKAYLRQNPQPTRYCEWTGVHCPVSFYSSCELRPEHEALQVQIQGTSDSAAREALEEQDENLSLQHCDLEITLGTEVDGMPTSQ